MNLNLEYGRPQVMVEKMSDPELTVNYIEFAVSSKYKEGLDGSLRRMWGRLQRKFDAAMDSKQYDVELETAEKDFILKAFKEAKYQADLSKWVNVLEDELNKLEA